MNLKLPLLLLFLIGIFNFSFAQFISLEGNWSLEEIELKEFASEDLSFTEEESFFGAYLNAGEHLSIYADKFPVMVGGDFYNYDYELVGSSLILESSNTVLVLKNGVQEELSRSGETQFKFKLIQDKLILSRRNETFFESYTFSKLN